MQPIPPVSVLAVPLVDRPKPDLAIQGPAEADASATDGEAGNPDARDPVLATDRAREIAGLLGAQPEDDFVIPGFPPLDTREVGDRDIIDPDRPAVRGPEPAPVPDPVERPFAGLPEMPDQAEARVGAGMSVGAGAKDVASPGTADAVDLPGAFGPTDGPDETPEPAAQEEAPPPVVTAQPASPGASAPDVPEPPAPGAVDIRR